MRDEILTKTAEVLGAHRLTFWSVYHWKDGGHEVAPRCTCGVLWSAHKRDDPGGQVAAWEGHLAQALRDAGVLRDESGAS